MTRRTFIYGLVYCAFYILFKLYLIVGGYALSRFGFYYSHAVASLMILLFYSLAIKDARDREHEGFIRGRDAVRIAFGIFAVAVVVTGVYNYLEYELSGKALAIEYYNSPQFTAYLEQRKVKAEEYSRIIEQQIRNAGTSGFKATTGKLFSFLIIGVSGAFIVAMLMKRPPK
jgi:hypothetical protein